MPLSPDQREYMRKSILRSISVFYGDRVPDLKAFQNKKRKSYLEKLESELNAIGWRKKIEEANVAQGHAQASLTKLENNRQVKQAELSARHQQELADLKARQEKERTDLILKYEPEINDAKILLSEKSKTVSQLKRESYFAGLNEEDDGRSIYHLYTIDDAIKQKVDQFIENNLSCDAEGVAVQMRLEQEDIVGQLVYIAKDIPELRQRLIEFIFNGELPNITMKAWQIVDGQDTRPKL